jgi:hypothetical protein
LDGLEAWTVNKISQLSISREMGDGGLSNEANSVRREALTSSVSVSSGKCKKSENKAQGAGFSTALSKF